MSRIRTLKPEILSDERLSPLPDATRLLAKGLILQADDHGRGKAHAGLLAVQVWPYGDPHESLTKVENGLRELADIGFVLVYKVKGQRYYALVNWRKHQRIQHVGKPRVPAPADEDDDSEDDGGSEPSGGGSRASPHTSGKSHEGQSSGDPHETLTPDLRSPIIGSSEGGPPESLTNTSPNGPVTTPPGDDPETEWSRRLRALWVGWAKRYLVVRGNHPADRHARQKTEIVRVLTAKAERDERGFDEVLEAVLELYWAEDYPRTAKNPPHMQNLLDQLDRLVSLLDAPGGADDEPDPPDWHPVTHGEPRSARNYRTFEEWCFAGAPQDPSWRPPQPATEAPS